VVAVAAVGAAAAVPAALFLGRHKSPLERSRSTLARAALEQVQPFRRTMAATVTWEASQPLAAVAVLAMVGVILMWQADGQAVQAVARLKMTKRPLVVQELLAKVTAGAVAPPMVCKPAQVAVVLALPVAA